VRVKLSEQIVLAVLVKRTCERRGPLGIDLNVFQSQVQSDSERDSERDSESEDFSTEIEIGRKRLRRRETITKNININIVHKREK
jgi:hypothetical protein